MMHGWTPRARRKRRIDLIMFDQLSRSFMFKAFRSELVAAFGSDASARIWRNANALHGELLHTHPDLDSDSKMMVLPAAALYLALKEEAPEQALPMLKAYGARTGERIAQIIHRVTSIPGIPVLLWRNMPRLMRSMSSPEKGYSRRIVSESNELVGVDILSCPLYDAAVTLGVPEAAQVTCAIDKACMTGFKHIRYNRTTSVAEGAECCDYRLSYDPNKL